MPVGSNPLLTGNAMTQVCLVPLPADSGRLLASSVPVQLCFAPLTASSATGLVGFVTRQVSFVLRQTWIEAMLAGNGTSLTRRQTRLICVQRLPSS